MERKKSLHPSIYSTVAALAPNTEWKNDFIQRRILLQMHTGPLLSARSVLLSKKNQIVPSFAPPREGVEKPGKRKKARIHANLHFLDINFPG